jgi:hypothetical protein
MLEHLWNNLSDRHTARSLKRLKMICAGLLAAAGLQANTVHVPLVGFAHGSGGSNTSWFTETRIWNLGSAPATVSITDVIGSGKVQPRTFTVPAGGLIDLPYYLLAGLAPNTQEDFLSAVEFASDQPLRVDTSINTYDVNPADCPSIYPGPLPTHNLFYPYWAGCVPVGGPLLLGFEDYLAASTTNGLSWLVSDYQSFRTTLYLTNPGSSPVHVTGIFRGVDGTAATVLYTVDPHSLFVVPQLFLEPVLQTIQNTGIGADGSVNGAATAVFTSDGRFYVFAVVLSNDTNGHSSVVNRFAVVQPFQLP